jgi:hypothetical protein
MIEKLTFLDCSEDQNTHSAGIIITDPRGVPRDVYHTSGVTPTPLQEILYGSSLETYVAIDCLALPLLKNLRDEPLILVRSQKLLHVRARVKIKTLLVTSGSPPCPHKRVEGSLGREFFVSPHYQFVEDLEGWSDLTLDLDPFEVFERISLFLSKAGQTV